jgi:hypothetical protein
MARVIRGVAVEVALGAATGALAATGVIVALSVPAPQAANSIKRQLVASRYSFGFAEKIAGSCNRTVRTHWYRETTLYASLHILAAGRAVWRCKKVFGQ